MPSRSFLNARAVACALAFAALVAAPRAEAQFPSQSQTPASLTSRLLAVEDARDLSSAGQTVLTEGMKSTDPRIRARAVRAAGLYLDDTLVREALARGASEAWD